MVFEEIIVNQFLQSFSNPLLNILFKGITELGNPVLWFLVAAILFWSGREKKSVMIMSLLLLAGFFAGILKVLIARPRPTQVLQLIAETGYSMPSGHATLSATVATYAWFSSWIQKNIKILLIVLAILISISRLYLGVHYLSDVLAGIALGIILGWFAFKLEVKINKMRFHVSKLPEEFLIVIFLVIMIISYLFVPAEYYGAYALLGYFFGYGIYKHTKMDLTKLQTKKQLALNIILGIGIFGVLGLVAYKSEGLLSQLLFFIAGIFITLIWPMVIVKLIIGKLFIEKKAASVKLIKKTKKTKK